MPWNWSHRRWRKHQAPPREKPRDCDHDRFHIFDFNIVGFGTCLDCHEEVPIYQLLNRLVERHSEELLRAIEIRRRLEESEYARKH